MTLLRRGSEVVTVYPEVVVVDSDGNTVTRCSAVGMVCRAVVQPISTDEKQDGGFQSEAKYRLRLVGFVGVLGAQSQVEWDGKRYSVFGDAKVFSGSSRTARTEYAMVRS